MVLGMILFLGIVFMVIYILSARPTRSIQLSLSGVAIQPFRQFNGQVLHCGSTWSPTEDFDLLYILYLKVILPGSKSLSNRALLTSALSKGTTEIQNLLESEDTRSMISSLEQLGVKYAWILMYYKLCE